MQVSGEHENQARSEQQEVDSDHDGQGLVHRRRADVVGQASQGENGVASDSAVSPGTAAHIWTSKFSPAILGVQILYALVFLTCSEHYATNHCDQGHSQPGMMGN